MTKTSIRCFIVILGLLLFSQPALAIPVDLELIIATDTSGSVDTTDFTLRRSGIEAAFRDADVISAIEGGAIGSIAVTLWDFGTSVGEAVDWTKISNATDSNNFADAVAAANRLGGGGDGQANMLRTAAAAINSNNFEGTRAIVDIISEGVQSGEGCSFDDPFCQATIDARDQFLAAGGTAVNAIWMNDRDFFGLDADDVVNAFEYGSTSVIGGTDAFQLFAETNEDFIKAFSGKLIREITPDPDPDPVPEPATMLLIGIGLFGLAGVRRKKYFNK
jgi:hypothetical protein